MYLGFSVVIVMVMTEYYRLVRVIRVCKDVEIFLSVIVGYQTEPYGGGKKHKTGGISGLAGTREICKIDGNTARIAMTALK